MWYCVAQVKQRRLEREAERAAREAEAGAAARAREAAQFSSWARQEDAFHLQQARLRSHIRIRDARGTTPALDAIYNKLKAGSCSYYYILLSYDVIQFQQSRLTCWHGM